MTQSDTAVALIGGSGFLLARDWHIADIVDKQETPYGAPSAPICHISTEGGVNFWFLPRHGYSSSHGVIGLSGQASAERILPHRINYRANIDALCSLGVKHIVSLSLAGSLTSDIQLGSYVVPDQLIDYTWGRESSFYESGIAAHCEFMRPFSASMRQDLLRASLNLGIEARDGGTYACTQGPRMETEAESRRLARDGCHIVGMTAMPEACLACERGINYAALCLISNDVFQAQETLISDIEQLIALRMSEISRLIPKVFARN